ncbi:hypothetical protein BH11MYX1_BH11MYX1_50070 [soil metagenome]
MSDASRTKRKPPHPFLYFLLFLPFGATSGFITVTMGAIAHRAGISDEVVVTLTATNTLPHTWKVFWGPLVDTVWTGRGWYITSNLVSSAAIITLGFIPIVERNFGLLKIVIFINGLATTFVGMCTEALMAKLTPPEQRGTAGGWSQAGNLGGQMVGGLGLVLANNLEFDWLPFVIVGGLLLSCSVVLGLVEEPKRDSTKSFGKSMVELGSSLVDLLFNRRRWDRVKTASPWSFTYPGVWLYLLSGAGVLAITLSLMPIGSGGAQNVFPLMGQQWHASDNVVSLTNGLIGGGSAIVGSLLGGLLANKIDKRWAYAISGVILAGFAFLMAITPETAPFYVGNIVLYSVGLGMCYATFSAFVLDIIGHTGGATKYNLFASMANWPIAAMGLIDGWVATHHGRITMLFVDGGAGVLGAVVLMTVVFVLRALKIPTRPTNADTPVGAPEHSPSAELVVSRD